ncbi:hypothetical protein DPEC_G00205920 [Dallia pectoralis]|uniref:Uncharacterized protein n=1 Tax=Dallia pectoralis TaxID=75939 RepID=A0ACC2G4T0_DALPE|nr:hypothetical protein DPEC_G00205920 [Dallia pectoralis]
MDKELTRVDVSKSFYCPSPSELDCCFVEQSLSVSNLSVEGCSMSLLPLNGVVVDYCDSKASDMASLFQSPNGASSCEAQNLNALLSKEATTPWLTVPVGSKSSTPTQPVLFQKPKLACPLEMTSMELSASRKLKTACPLDLSYIDLTASQVAWEVSLIKTEMNSPKPILESSTLELTWSPKFQSAPPSLAEISLIWSGTPPYTNNAEENQRSWNEATLGSSLSQTSSLTPAEQAKVSM